MRFYRLAQPRTGDDNEDDRLNPVRCRKAYRLPTIDCEQCIKYATSKRLRIPLPPAELMAQFEGPRFVSPADWQSQLDDWATLLGVPRDVLAPAMELGPPHGFTIGLITQDVVHPSPGRIWVNDKVRRMLEAADFTGIQLAEVQLERGTEHPAPRLWEIIALGNAGVIAPYSEEGLPPCPICGRPRSGWSGLHYVDETTWDGSDFFKLEDNLATPLVTERVREHLERIGTTNLAFEAVQGRRAEDDEST